MYCSRCGNEISCEAKYCSKCGIQLKSTTANDVADEWFYINNNLRYGSFSKETMIGFVQNRRITRETLVWYKGMLNWVPAAQTELIDTIKNVAPPLPYDAVSSKYAWSLATIPILISWFVELIGCPSEVVITSAIALNVIFLMLDSDELNKSDINVNGWMWMGLVLVPVYLFVRASKTNKKYGYAITCCLMLVVDLLI